MYNYNTNETGLGAFIRDLVIKLIFVIILVLLLIWLFPMPNMKPFYDRIYTENIFLMKDVAKNYYTNERMPVNVNDKVTMTLGEMQDKHLLLSLIDKNGNTCDSQRSYVEVTKLETEYALKVYLTCGNESDYIIEYIGCLDVCIVCEDKPLKEEVKEVVAKPRTIIKTKEVIKKVPVIKEVIKEVEVIKVVEVIKEVEVIKYITIPCDECPTEEPETEIWLLYGLDPETSIGSWTTTKRSTGSTTSGGVTTTISLYDTKTDGATTEYVRNKKMIYSAMWIRPTQTFPANVTYPGERLLDLAKVGLSSNARNLSLSQLDMRSTNGIQFSSNDYQNYVDRDRALFLGVSDSYGSTVYTANQMRDAALKAANFDVTSINLVWNSSRNTYQVVTRAYLRNKTGVQPFYDSRLGHEVIYVPHKFEVSWNEPKQTTGTTYYKYKTTKSYESKWVLKGSSEETTLKSKGYTVLDTKTVTK